MVSVCQSLHRVALQCQQDAEGCWYFHQMVVPCLLAMAVQAAMQGKCRAGVGEGRAGNSQAVKGPRYCSQCCCCCLLAPVALKSRLHCSLPLSQSLAPLWCRFRGCACLLPLNSRLQQVPFLPLPAESTHRLPGKALLDEEVLAAMIPVISAATTHLSPE